LPAIQNSGDSEAAKEPEKGIVSGPQLAILGPKSGRIANKNRKKSTKNDEDF